MIVMKNIVWLIKETKKNNLGISNVISPLNAINLIKLIALSKGSANLSV